MNEKLYDEFHLINEVELNEEDEPPSSLQPAKDLIREKKNQQNIPIKKTPSNQSNNPKKICCKEKNNLPTQKDWNNWEWQIKNSITSYETLNNYFSLNEDEIAALEDSKGLLPLRITPYYADVISKSTQKNNLRKCVIPLIDEHILSHGEVADPLCEESHRKADNLIHRYPDRVLFLATDFCSTYCRYCTRSRIVGKTKNHENSANKNKWAQAFNYIENHQEIRDVLISGGDPLTLSDEKLFYILSHLKAIKHLEMIRIGTKVPVVLPQRITTSFVQKIKNFHPLYLSIHFTHPDEITPEVSLACERLADAGIPLGSQTVLLKGVNDDAQTLKTLFHKLLQIRVKPYYLYQCDPIKGSAHFRTSIEKGLNIMHDIRGYTSGYAVPTYVIDAPGGGGKTPLLPEYFLGVEDGNVMLRNYEGKVFQYPNGKD